MRILIVAGDDEAAGLAEALRTGGHDVWTASTDAEALGVRAERGLDLAIVSAAQQGDGPIASIRALQITTPRPYVLLLHPSLSDEYIVRALEAGADADLKSPLTPKYLAARLGAVERRSTLPPQSAAMPSFGGLLPAALRPPNGSLRVMPSALESTVRSVTWITAAEQMASAASKFLTLPVGWDVLPGTPPAASIGACIVLLDAQQQLEMRIAMAADAASARALAVHLFGVEGEDLALDVMTELANILMGTLKTAFSGENLSFTGGLPMEIPVEEVLRPAMPFKFQEAVVFTIADARLVVHLGLRSRANEFLPTARLREGMVVAKDVFSARGMLLLDGGTRLSSHMVERLRAALPAQHSVEVIAA